MERRQFLQIPGPTNIPARILRTLSQPMVNHRGSDFQQMVEECLNNLKKVFRTNNDILVFPSSGSGMLESAVVNLLSPGDKILAISQGVFSERMATIAEKHNLQVRRLTKEWGFSVKAEEIQAVLEQDKEKEIKAVCLPHNETSTAVSNDLKEITKAIKEIEHPALIMVDAISSLACLPLETDSWNIDVVVASSQKGLMLPPGLGFVSVSDRAWESIETSSMPKWYWEYRAVKDSLKHNVFPYTPATTLFFGLKESLYMLAEEGIENVWERHALMAEAVRNAARAINLSLFAKEEKAYSNTVTAILVPDQMSYTEFAKGLKAKFDLEIGGGLQQLKGQIFRIGHLGSIHHLEIYAIMGAVEMMLSQMGFPLTLGSTAEAVERTFLSHGMPHRR